MNKLSSSKKTRPYRDNKTSERGFLLRLKISKYKNHTTYTLTLKKPQFSLKKIFSKNESKPKAVSKKLMPRKAPQPRSSLGELINAGLVLAGVAGIFTVLIPMSPVKFSYNSPVSAAKASSSSFVGSTDKPKLIYSLSPSVPTQLTVPSIDLDTSLISTTVGDSGELMVPSRYDVAAWYDKSPTPGEIGPSVIVGHLNSFQGDAIFSRLSELTKDAAIVVTRADGQVANFKVEVVQEVPQDGFTTDEVYGNINYAGLRLITCGGTYNYLTGRFTNNTIVFARLSKY